jgi:hypothetical protein
VAFILSANVNRRHLSAGQRAMLTVKAWALTGNLSLRETAEHASLNRERVRIAAVVLHWATDLGARVVAGRVAPSAAYQRCPCRPHAGMSTGRGKAGQIAMGWRPCELRQIYPADHPDFYQ